AALVLAAIAMAGIGICAPVAILLAHNARGDNSRRGGIAFAAWALGIVGTIAWLGGIVMRQAYPF
ncbi:MAG: hypothetical protein ACR2MB_04440, partial [Acidimicrobiales bacterium]